MTYMCQQMFKVIVVSIVLTFTCPVLAHGPQGDEVTNLNGACIKSMQDMVPQAPQFFDNYTYDTHLRMFWTIHKRFGFLRTDDGVIVLVAKSRDMANKLIQSLRQYTNNFKSEAKEIRIAEIQDGFQFDVTALLPPLVRDNLGTRPERANCWGVCMIHAGVISEFRIVAESDFRSWLMGPLFQKVFSVQEIRPGDIMALSDNYGDIHGAVYISPDLVFTRNGAMNDIHLMDTLEMRGIYSAADVRVEIFRPKSLIAP